MVRRRLARTVLLMRLTRSERLRLPGTDRIHRLLRLARPERLLRPSVVEQVHRLLRRSGLLPRVVWRLLPRAERLLWGLV